MKKVVLILSEGYEELEAISVIDILRRAGVTLEVVGVGDTNITGAHGVTMVCDDVYEYYGMLDFDGVVLVGGMQNATALSQDESVIRLIQEYVSCGKMVAGICATPALVFSEAGILDGRSATCYPSDSLVSQLGMSYVDEACVVDGNIITSQSPDTALEFALTIVEYLGYNASAVYSDLQGK